MTTRVYQRGQAIFLAALHRLVAAVRGCDAVCFTQRHKILRFCQWNYFRKPTFHAGNAGALKDDFIRNSNNFIRVSDKVKRNSSLGLFKDLLAF